MGGIDLKRVYFVTLIEALFFLGVLAYYVINTIRRRGNIVGEEPFGELGKSFFSNHLILVNIISHGFMIILSVGLLRFFCIPVLMDFPNAINNKYIEKRGEVTKWSYSQENTNKLRWISIIDENHDEIRVRVYSYGVHKGDIITVQYYEHSKYGRVKYN